MKINERFRFLRGKLELSQQDAASKFDIPVGSWKKYELGPSEPGSGALRNLAAGGVNIHWLLTGEGEMLTAALPPRPKPPADTKKTNEPAPEAAPIVASAHAEPRAKLDTAVLIEVFINVDEALAEHQLTLPQQQKAVLCQLVYEYATHTHTSVPTTVARFMLLLQ